MIRLMQQIQKFQLISDYSPAGDQPEAIERLVKGVKNNKIQTLLGVTGSGKTFTVANVIQQTGKKHVSNFAQQNLSCPALF